MMATLMPHQRSLIAYPSSITLDMSRLIESMKRKKKKKKVLLFFGETRERESAALDQRSLMDEGSGYHCPTIHYVPCNLVLFI